jgi:hypothetical protein
MTTLYVVFGVFNSGSQLMTIFDTKEAAIDAANNFAKKWLLKDAPVESLVRSFKNSVYSLISYDGFVDVREIILNNVEPVDMP